MRWQTQLFRHPGILPAPRTLTVPWTPLLFPTPPGYLFNSLAISSEPWLFFQNLGCSLNTLQLSPEASAQRGEYGGERYEKLEFQIKVREWMGVRACILSSLAAIHDRPYSLIPMPLVGLHTLRGVGIPIRFPRSIAEAARKHPFRRFFFF